MSISRRAREDLGHIGESVPEGFLRADELMEYALPALWGEGFLDAAVEALPVGVEASQVLRSAIDNGRVVGVAGKLLASLKSGTLIGWILRKDKSGSWAPAEEIPISDWSTVERHSLVDVLRTGTSDPCATSMPRWNDKAVIAFRLDDAERWLDENPAATELPPIDDLSRSGLPYDNVRLSQALCWRAGQQADHWYDVITMGASLRDLAGGVLLSPDEIAADHEFDDRCLQLAEQLAAKIQRNSAARELLQLMASGHLVGSGIRRGGPGVLEEIAPSEFKTRKEIVPFEDMLAPGKPADDEETTIADREPIWEHVRLLTVDLLRAYGVRSREPAADTSPSAGEAVLLPMPKRRPSMKAARKALEARVQEAVAEGLRLTYSETEVWLREEYDLSRDEARALWKDKVPAEWQLPGRPPDRKTREK